MSRSALAFFALVVSVPFATPLACGGSEPPPAVPGPTTSSGAEATPITVTSLASSSSSASAMPPAASPSALAAIVTTDPSQLTAIADAAAKAAPAKAHRPGEEKELEKGLVAVATTAAPGMKPEGEIASGTLKEGEHLTWSVTMTPGKCYAVVGYSPSGEVQDLDLHLLAPPFFSMLAGEDVSDDNAPVVGGGPNPMCPVAAVKLPYKVDIASQKGAGRAAVQLFSKAK